MQVHVYLSLAALMDYNETCSHTQMFRLLDVYMQSWHSSSLVLILPSPAELLASLEYDLLESKDVCVRTTHHPLESEQ